MQRGGLIQVPSTVVNMTEWSWREIWLLTCSSYSPLQCSWLIFGGSKPLTLAVSAHCTDDTLSSNDEFSFQLCLVRVTVSSEPQPQRLLGHTSSVPWEQAKGPFLCRPSLSVHRLLLFPAWLRWSWGWKSWEGGGVRGIGVGWGGVGAQQSISPSRKTEKVFRLSSSCRPCSCAQCLCLLNFPIISSSFLSLMFFFHILGGTEFDQKLHFSSDVCEQTIFFEASQTVVSVVTLGCRVKSHSRIQPCSLECHSQFLLFRLSYLSDPNTDPLQCFSVVPEK